MWFAVFRKETKIVITENVMDTIGNQLKSMLAYATCIFSGLEIILFKNSKFVKLFFVLLVSCQLVLVALMFLLVLLVLLILFFLIRGSSEKIYYNE
jgi:hypothetical protein